MSQNSVRWESTIHHRTVQYSLVRLYEAAPLCIQYAVCPAADYRAQPRLSHCKLDRSSLLCPPSARTTPGLSETSRVTAKACLTKPGHTGALTARHGNEAAPSLLAHTHCKVADLATFQVASTNLQPC